MIPVLYKANAVDFSTFGIGVLRDCTSCEVTEERNGAFECILRYPVNGPLFKELRNERIVKAKSNDTADDQAFRIYRITTPINGEVTVYAQHLSYDLSNVAVLAWESSSTTPVHAMQRIFDNTATDHNFTCLSDEGDAKPFSVAKPQSIRACLGGTEGSILDLWGGEYEWDNFKVIRHRKRGQDTGVVIEYGKNLTELEHDCDGTEVYTDLLPYAVTTTGDGTEIAVTLPEILLPIADTDLVQRKTMIMDMSEYFGEEEAITVDGLRAHANKYLEDHPLGTLSPTLTVSFEPLWKQPQYAAVLERVSLCDTVTVRHRMLQITTKTKVITTVYDTLAEKYISISLGSARANLLENISSAESAAEDAASKIKNFKTFIDAAVKNATNQIVGQKGGYVVINTATDTGLPYELLILDQPTIEEAVNVWRWNSGGLGFSKTGYNGPYTTAITADGEIVADFITSGALTANIIKAGVLQSADGSSYWNLDTGEVHFSAYSGETDVTQIKEDIDGLKETVSTHSERFSEFQSSVDGLNSYVASLTETVETISGDMEEDQKTVLEMQAKMTELQQTVDGINIAVTEQYAGGMNLIQNSAGLNGITDDWQTTGVVSTDSSTDVRNNTASDCSFILGDTSTLQQDIVGVVTGSSYSVSVRAKKTGADYTSYVRVQYNGSKYVDLFNQTETFEWMEFSAVIPDVQDGTISIIVYNRLADLFVSDMVLTAGSTVHKWMPAPNEIYTTEVKIDRKGIEVSNPESSQRTVINNQEFSGYYNEEKIFTLNKDETVTKKTTVDGELTVGKTKFVPMPTASEGLNIVILD